MRGANHLAGKHSFRITDEGCEVFARLETIVSDDRSRAVGPRLSCGVPRLDELMGGGTPAGDATAILGPSGCGKTVLALRFIAQGLADGENCLYASFQESADQLVDQGGVVRLGPRGAARVGTARDPPRPAGRAQPRHPRRRRSQRIWRAASIRRVILDSLAELVVAVHEIDRFPAYARSLIGFIRAGGASVVVTSETTALGPEAEPVAGLSFLFNNVLLLRYLEMESETRRALSVLKMRDSNHEKGVYQFEVDEQGFQVMDKLEGLTGVLGWSALSTRAANDRRLA